MKKPYELINRGEIAVVIKTVTGKSFYYPYEDICSYLEVDAQLNRDTLEIVKFRDREEWSYRLMRNLQDPLANWQGREQAINYNMASEEAIVDAEKQVLKNLENLKKKVRKAHKNPVWKLMKPIADRLVKHYSSDFYYWDALNLLKFQPEKFIWICGNSGTTMLFYSNNDQSYLNQRSSTDEREYYYWNGLTLSKLTQEQAKSVFKTLPESKDEN